MTREDWKINANVFKNRSGSRSSGTFQCLWAWASVNFSFGDGSQQLCVSGGGANASKNHSHHLSSEPSWCADTEYSEYDGPHCCSFIIQTNIHPIKHTSVKLYLQWWHQMLYFLSNPVTVCLITALLHVFYRFQNILGSKWCPIFYYHLFISP